MKSKTILGADGTTKMRQITVGIHGKGGETGIKAVMLLTALINDLTTLKFTSASNKAILTSLSAAFTSSSVKRPLLRRFLKTFCSFSVKLSNAINTSLSLTD